MDATKKLQECARSTNGFLGEEKKNQPSYLVSCKFILHRVENVVFGRAGAALGC